MANHTNRADWFAAAAKVMLEDHIIPELHAHSLPHDMPPLRINCGWPKGVRGGRKHQVLGACYPRARSEDGHNEVFIAPTIADPVRALDVLVHEILHAIDDCKHGHKGPFPAMAAAVGLEGKPTCTKAGADLKELLTDIAAELGEFPAAPMTDESYKPKQSTRMKKVECSNCGFTARTTRKWIEQLPENAQCPICTADSLSAV